MTLKNPFAISQSQTASGIVAAVKKKATELRAGKLARSVQSLTNEIESLHHQVEQKRRQLGECEMEGLDTTQAQADLQRSLESLRACEAALDVAKHNAAEAQQQHREATRQAEIDTIVSAVQDLKAAATEVDELLSALERHVTTKLAPRLDRARIKIGPGIESNFLTEAVLGFEQCLLHACRTIIKSKNVYGFLLKDRKFSDYIPTPEDVLQLKERA